MLVSDARCSQDQPLSSLLSPLVAASRRGGAWFLNSLVGAVRGLITPIRGLRVAQFLKQFILGLDKTMADQTTGDLVARQEWLEPLESGLQNTVRKTFEAGGDAGVRSRFRAFPSLVR
jgi:hypothetical protein